MIRIRHKYDANFTQVSNQLPRDTRISYKARGIFLYLWSLSDKWEISLNDIELHSSIDGQDSVRTGVRELERHGYVKFQRLQDKPSGQFLDTLWTLDDSPSLDYPNVGEPNVGEPTLGNPPTQNTVRKKTTKEEYPPKVPQGTRTRKKKQLPTPEAEGVLGYLNQMNNRHYENAEQIQALLNSSVSVEDCGLVIDFGLAVLKDERPEWYQQYWDNVTPFRPANFDKYRARAREWEDKKRQIPTKKFERLPL